MSYTFNPFTGQLDYYATSFADITVSGKVYLGNANTYLWYDGVDSVVLVVNGLEMQKWTNATSVGNYILYENGDRFALENGDLLTQE